MDFLIRLNGYGLVVKDVPRTAIYLPGERQSQIKGLKYLVTVSPMLVKGFLWRLRFKYVYRDFHPLILFYFSAMGFLSLGGLGGLWLVVDRLFWGGYQVTASRSIAICFLLSTGLQLGLFAMFFDREESKQELVRREADRKRDLSADRDIKAAS
jgi:hypothetical protein